MRLLPTLIAAAVLVTPASAAAKTIKDRDNGFKLTVTSSKKVTLKVPAKFTGSDALLSIACDEGPKDQFAASDLIGFQFIGSERVQSGRGAFFPGKRRFCEIEKSRLQTPAPVRTVAKFKLR